MDYSKLCSDAIDQALSNKEDRVDVTQYIVEKTNKTYSEVTEDYHLIENETKRALMSRGLHRSRFEANDNGLVWVIFL